MLQHRFEFLWLLALPLSWLWGWVSAYRIRHRRAEPPLIPVISVGNIHSGGSGKTPLLLSLVNHFQDNCAVLSRGYRAPASRVGALVDLKDARGPSFYGDEPWMIASHSSASVFVGQNRRQLFERQKISEKFKLCLLDDGFQHVQMGRHFDLVAIGTSKDPRQSFCIPAGELREQVSGLSRAHAFVLVGKTPGEEFGPEWKTWLTS